LLDNALGLLKLLLKFLALVRVNYFVEQQQDLGLWLGHYCGELGCGLLDATLLADHAHQQINFLFERDQTVALKHSLSDTLNYLVNAALRLLERLYERSLLT
jgi:hypothetical protein